MSPLKKKCKIEKEENITKRNSDKREAKASMCHPADDVGIKFSEYIHPLNISAFIDVVKGNCLSCDLLL